VSGAGHRARRVVSSVDRGTRDGRPSRPVARSAERRPGVVAGSSRADARHTDAPTSRAPRARIGARAGGCAGAATVTGGGRRKLVRPGRPWPRHHRPSTRPVRSPGPLRGRRLQPHLQLREVLPRPGWRRLVLPVLRQLPATERPLRQAVCLSAGCPTLLWRSGKVLRVERVLLQGLDLPTGLQDG
jgi:hypothetical protein